MGFEIAGNPAATVEKHHGRRILVGDAVDARGQRTRGASHLRILCTCDPWQRNGGARGGERAELIARTLRRHRIGVAERQQRNDASDGGIERCGHEAPGHWKLRQHRFRSRLRQRSGYALAVYLRADITMDFRANRATLASVIRTFVQFAEQCQK